MCFRWLLLVCALGASAWANDKSWVVEQLPGGRVVRGPAHLEIFDDAGCTVWWHEKLRAPVVIRFDVTMVAEGGPQDRVSDANCFFLATDGDAPEGCPFAPGHGRTGRFADYDSLKTYYVGMGGNTNSTTRFRRYAGDGTKPLSPEHDLRAKEFLLEPNQKYAIEIRVSDDGTVEYRRDGKVFFNWKDPAPLTEGWFGFRTVKSHQRIENFRVEQR